MLSPDELKEAWNRFDVPVDKDDNIEEDFEVDGIVFKKGTDKFEVWHWFDEQFKEGLFKEMFG